MRSTFLSIGAGLFLLLLSSLAGAAPLEIEGVTQSPVVRPQLKTPWCYAMASRTLLDQVICESAKNCASDAAPDVAVAGFISAQIEHQIKSKLTYGFTETQLWFSGGDQKTVLEDVSKTGSIPTSSCTHENELFRLHADPKLAPGLPLSTQLKAIYEAFEASLTTHMVTSPNASRQEWAQKWITDLSLSIGSRSPTFLVGALAQSRTLGEFTRLALLPTECAENKLLLPKFKVFGYSETDPQKIESKIDGALRKHRLVSLSICAKTISEHVADECGGHAVVVSQSRQVCENGRQPCQKEYRFLDSSFFSSAQRNLDGSYWLPAGLVIKATQNSALYIQKVFRKIRDDYDSSIKKVGSDSEDSLAKFEGFVLGLKVSYRNTVEQFKREAYSARERTRAQLSKLTEEQRAQVIREVPNMALIYDDLAFDRTIKAFADELARNLEQMRKDQELKNKEFKAEMARYLSMISNPTQSSSNIVWLEPL